MEKWSVSNGKLVVGTDADRSRSKILAWAC